MGRQVLAVMGSYRRGRVIDTLVEETLRGAREAGAATHKLCLLDVQIEFCTNCRSCTQTAGPEPGACVLDDAFAEFWDRYREADGLVLGAPVNFYNVNAVTRRFLERLVCCTYWPWGAKAPRVRVKDRGKSAVLITSAAMPGFLLPLFTGAPRALRGAAATLGARPVAKIYAGLVSDREDPVLPAKVLHRARAAGRRLATG